MKLNPKSINECLFVLAARSLPSRTAMLFVNASNVNVDIVAAIYINAV